MSYKVNRNKSIEEIKTRVKKEIKESKRSPLWRYMNENILR